MTVVPETSPVDVVVTIGVQNFEIVDNMGDQPAEGEGHVVFYLDVFPPTDPDRSALPEEGIGAVAVADTTYTWTNVPPGQHLFSVQLVNNDGTPLDPPVVDAVVFNVPSAVEANTMQTGNVQAGMPAITSISVVAQPGQVASPTPDEDGMPDENGMPSETTSPPGTATMDPEKKGKRDSRYN